MLDSNSDNNNYKSLTRTKRKTTANVHPYEYMDGNFDSIWVNANCDNDNSSLVRKSSRKKQRPSNPGFVPYNPNSDSDDMDDFIVDDTESLPDIGSGSDYGSDDSDDSDVESWFSPEDEEGYDDFVTSIRPKRKAKPRPPRGPPKKVYEVVNPDYDPMFAKKLYSKLKKITNLQNLIDLGMTFHEEKNTTYKGINLKMLFKAVPHLTELNGMIGLDDIKQQLIDQILHFARGLHLVSSGLGSSDDPPEKKKKDIEYTNPQDMLHTIITGPSGVGKTHFAKCLGKVMASMGLLSKGNFVKIGREDLIAEYLGQTTHRVANLFKKYKGCTIFLDEAYSLGSWRTGEDMYAKEAIDKLTEILEKERDVMFIIAGYEYNMNRSLFGVNEGLRRRFTYKYTIKGYKWHQLYDIFERKLEKDTWKLEKADVSRIKTLFRRNYGLMPKFGGDVETLLSHSKTSDNRSLDYMDNGLTLTYKRVKKGFEKLKKCRNNYDTDKRYLEGMF